LGLASRWAIVIAMKVRLDKLVLVRSGDKGDGSNVGVIARSPEVYSFLETELTSERVKAHFHSICMGDVERFLAPNILSLNFLLHDSLGGGGSASLKTDAQGKTHGLGLSLMEMDVPDEVLASLPD
jgi:hypothetical protein